MDKKTYLANERRYLDKVRQSLLEVVLEIQKSDRGADGFSTSPRLLQEQADKVIEAGEAVLELSEMLYWQRGR